MANSRLVPVMSAQYEEGGRLLRVSCAFFGDYTMPRPYIDGMSAQHIVAQVAPVATGVLAAYSPSSLDSPPILILMDSTDEQPSTPCTARRYCEQPYRSLLGSAWRPSSLDSGCTSCGCI